MKKTGIIFGKFYPVHQGHVHFIEQASQYVEDLYVVLCSHTVRDYYLWETSQLQFEATPADRLIWLKAIFAQNEHIQILHLHEEGVPLYPFGWEAWSQQVKQLCVRYQIDPDIIFTNEIDDLDNYNYYFDAHVQLLDTKRINIPVSGTQVRQHLWRYWPAIPLLVRPALQQKILIVGTDAKIVAQQLSRTFNTICQHGEINQCLEAPFVFVTDSHQREQAVLKFAIDDAMNVQPHLLVGRSGAYMQIFKAIKQYF
ncbi:MAG: adenylyltransferase/cytidyltransferase family protein [Culicoidibacterales bacterium]